MLSAPILCGGIIKNMKIGKFIYRGFLVISMLIFVMALFTSNYISYNFNTNLISYTGLLIVSFIVGIVVTLVNIGLGTLFDKTVPLSMMGRTSTVFSFAVTVFIPLGQMISGFLLDITFPSIVVSLSGMILLITIIKYKKPLINYDITESKKEENIYSNMKEVL